MKLSLIVKISIVLIIPALLSLPYGYAQKHGDSERVTETKTTSLEQKIGVGYVAPGFTLNDLNGNAVRLSDYAEKVVILNFWNLW